MVNGQETDRKSKLVLTYQGMDFIRGINPEELKELSKSYDYIFISMGYEENKELLDLCKNIFLCTDQQLQHILQLRYVDCIDQSKSYLLFSSSEDKRIDANYIQALSEITFDKDHICEFICDEKDQLLKLNCQYRENIIFKGLSKSMKECIVFIFKVIGIWDEHQKIRKAYRTASHGRKEL